MVLLKWRWNDPIPKKGEKLTVSESRHYGIL